MLSLRYIPDSAHEYRPKPVEGDMPDNLSIALSSGIDSHFLLQAITSTNYYASHKFTAITCDFKDTRDSDTPESIHAQEIAERYRIDFKRIVIDDPLRDLTKLLEIVGEPRYNLYQYYLYKEAGQVLITGDGADESYLGYVFRYRKYLDSIHKCKTWQDRAKLYLSCHQNDWVPDQEQLFNDSCPFNWDLILNHLKQFFFVDFDNHLNTLEDNLGPVMLADISGKLKYDFVPSNNKIADSMGLTLISPFLDTNMFSEIIRSPINLRYDYKSNTGKLPLRKSIGRMTDSTKRGFGFDLLKYWERVGFDRVTKLINKDSKVFDYISRDWWNKNLSSVETRYINKFLQVYTLELYLQLLEQDKIEMRIQQPAL